LFVLRLGVLIHRRDKKVVVLSLCVFVRRFILQSSCNSYIT
jgi:hypothetical protein